jgi:hypothetical protein
MTTINAAEFWKLLLRCEAFSAFFSKAYSSEGADRYWIAPGKRDKTRD